MSSHFWARSKPLSLSEIIELTSASLVKEVDVSGCYSSVASLEMAGPCDVSFAEKPAYRDALRQTSAGVCLVLPELSDDVPPHSIALVTSTPHAAFNRIAAQFYPESHVPKRLYTFSGIDLSADIHPNARIESGAVIDTCATIGEGAEIGTGTYIAPHAVIGPQVTIGRHCSIGPHVSLIHAHIGDHVIIHGGCRIGQDGFGYMMSAQGHQKVPQLGRVLIQDRVEIGANCTIDRGSIRDTVIGEGTKIDNLVQVAHNVHIGRHCVIVAQTGISGSVELADYVVLGGQVGVKDHIRIGEGAQIASSSAVATDVPAKVKWGGIPARPLRDWFREVIALERLAKRSGRGDTE